MPLTGRLLQLTPLTLNDAEDYLAALGSRQEADQVTAHLTFGPPGDLVTARAHLAAALADHDRIAYAQRLIATGEFVGTTSFYEIRPSVRAIAIGHTWIGSRHWRTGVNSDSKLIMLSRAFEELSAERVVWHTDIRNERSQAAITRLGAQREGVLRHHRIRKDGTWRDTVQFSMLAHEWPAAKERLLAAARIGNPLTDRAESPASGAI